MSTPYEEIVKGLDTGKDRSPYTAIIAGLKAPKQQESLLRDSANQAVAVQPDRAAEVDTLSKVTGLPPDLVERNFDVIKAKAKTDSTPYGDIIRDTPRLAEWLKDPKNAAQTQDDLPHMGYFDWTLSKIQDLAHSAFSGIELGTGSALSGVPALSDAVGRLAPFLTVGGSDLPVTTPGPWWASTGNMFAAAGKAVTGRGKAIEVPKERQNIVTDVTSGLGQMVPMIAAGMLAGPASAIPIFAGQGANDMAERTAADDSPQYKKDLSTLAGAGIAIGTGEFGLNTLLKRVPFPIRNAIVSKLADLAAAGGIQAVQAGSQTFLNNLTRRVLTDSNQSLTEGVGAGMGSGAATGAVARLLLTSLMGVQAESHFRERQDTLKQATDAVKASKLYERNPDALRDFIAQHAANGPNENVLIPVDTFREYFQSKGVDPVQAAGDLMAGGAEAFRDAAATGADLPVPFADYETKLAPEHGKFFDQEVRFHPTEMNAREFEEMKTREGATLDQEQKASKPDAAIEASGEKIKQDILGQITGEFDPVAAETNATAVAEVFKTLGQRVGADPFELYSKYNLKVKFPLPDILKSRTSVDAMDAMIERLRSGDVPTPGELYGDSLVEWLRKNGGVQDVGGDLTSREIDKENRPFQRNVVQESGMPLDTAVLRAREEGYIPESADINDLIDTIDNELRGDPVYSQHALDTPEVERASALFQLEQYVKERGIDLKALSNEQVKKILSEAANVEQAGDGLEFFQALFHGSPHDFEKFSTDKIGMGEGVQAYGHGLYFAENQDVAKGYHKKLSDWMTTGDRKGGVYQVEIPDEKLEGFLDWDKPLSQQPENVRVALVKLIKELNPTLDTYMRRAEGKSDKEQRQIRQDLGINVFDTLDTGGAIYQRLGDPRKVSRWLADEGVFGIKYLDANSRGSGEGSRNVVVFDDSIITLTHKDGTPVTPKERKEFLQQDPQQNKRGSLVFNADGSFNINLFAKRNLSTFIHETGHFYLEVLGDLVDQLKVKDPSTLTATQQQMVADYGKVLKYLGVENRGGIQEDQHETFARTLEAYVREGKSPSIELRPIFARFRSWLIDLYRTARGLNVEMTPEIREVMDRLFATDEAIDRAAHEAEIKSLFMTQEESGLDNEGWQAFQSKLQKASDEAKNELHTKLMKEFAREREDWWKTEQEKLRGEIASQVYKQPEYVALSALKRGQYPDGAESPISVKLDLNAIKERFGKNTTITDAIRKLGVARLEGGLDPDVAARQFGYPSGEALVTALVNARPMNELIDAETHDEMIRRHGDMRLDGSIHDEAQQAVMGKYRDEVVREEMRTLKRLQEAGRPAVEAEQRRQLAEREYERRWFEAEGKLNVAIAEGRKQAEIDSLRAEAAKIKADQKAAAQAFVGNLRGGQGIPTPQQVARFATDKLQTTIIGDVVPARYWAAARKASREALTLFAKGERDTALAAKGRELLNLELYRQSTALKVSFEKTRTDWLKMFKADSKIAPKRSMEYVTAARAIAAKLLFPDRQGRVMESMEALKRYDPDAFDDVQDAIASIVDDPRRLKDLSVEEFNGVRDIVSSLWNRARQDNQVTVDGKKLDRQKVQDDLVTNIGEYPSKAGRLGKNATITDIEKAGVNGLSLLASLRRVESWVEAMDGKQEGPWRTYVWQPVKEAIDAYRLQKVDELTKYAEILKPIESTLSKDWITSPELNYTFKGGKAELLGAMLHSGNRESPMSNLSKLLRGRRDENNIPWGSMREDGTLDTSKWDKMVDRMQKDGTLTKADYDYMQGVWDLFEGLKPGLQASHHETKGFYFKEVPADSFETPWGSYRGGYVPAKTDPFMSTAAAIRSDKQAMSEAGNSYALPSAGLGNTKTRLAVAEPLSMNLQFIPGHIDWALRLTHIDPRVKDVSKIIFDRSFRAAIDGHNPAVVKDMLVPWLQRAATQRLEEMGKYKAIDWFARLLRTGSGIQAVSFSVNNALQQATGLFLTNTKVPAGKLLSALTGYVSSPTKFADSIMAKSDFMRTFETNRAMEIQQDINNIVLDPNVYAKAQNFTRKHGQVMAGMTQGMVNLVSWQGAYDAAVEAGVTETQAVRRADSVIRATQGSFFPEDISRAETGTPFVRALTMFSSYFNMQANLLATEGSKAIHSDAGAMTKAGRLLSVYAVGFMLPSVMVQAIQNGITGNWKEEDDSYMMGAMKLFFGSQMRAAAMMVPGAGGVLQAGMNSILTKSTYDDDIRTTPWLQMHGKGIKDFGVWWNEGSDATESAKESARKNLGKDALNILGIYSKLPLGPLGKPLGFLMDLDAGKVRPKGPGDVVRGLVIGSIPKE